jgi:hypothetical protein
METLSQDSLYPQKVLLWLTGEAMTKFLCKVKMEAYMKLTQILKKLLMILQNLI